MLSHKNAQGIILFLCCLFIFYFTSTFAFPRSSKNLKRQYTVPWILSEHWDPQRINPLLSLPKMCSAYCRLNSHGMPPNASGKLSIWEM